MAGATQRRNGGTAAQANNVLKVGVPPHIHLFGYVTGDSRADVPGACADQKGVDLPRIHVRFFQRSQQGCARENRSFPLEYLVKILGIELEYPIEILGCEVSLLDTTFSEKNSSSELNGSLP